MTDEAWRVENQAPLFLFYERYPGVKTPSPHFRMIFLIECNLGTFPLTLELSREENQIHFDISQ